MTLTIETREAIRKPKLGFLGAGWIGRQRMSAIDQAGAGEVYAIAEPSPENAAEALVHAEHSPPTILVQSLDDLLKMDLDGIVIATPSALHAEQAAAALESGAAVFCQKPLGRSAEEVHQVVAAARQANRLLDVDLSYRYTTAARAMFDLVHSGELGEIYAVNLVFHNAYGPDKPWFYDPRLSGGGCVIDLGIHLVDLVLWLLDFPQVINVTSRLFCKGAPLTNRETEVEDFATACLDLTSGVIANLTCSWNLHTGCDAIFEMSVYGTRGAVSMHNVGGSFYDFVSEHFQGTKRMTLTEPPDEWGGRAAVAWAQRLAWDRTFDPEAERLIDVAEALDAIYAGANKCAS